MRKHANIIQVNDITKPDLAESLLQVFDGSD